MHTASTTDDTSETSNTSAVTKLQTASTVEANTGINAESPPAQAADAPTPSTSKEDVPSTPNTSKENASTLNSTSDLGSRTETKSSSEQEMLRKRRLQKFLVQSTTE